MVRISCAIAKKNDAPALITGDSLGQVASQTLQAISVVDAVSDIPVFRPLIGQDKEEVVSTSRQIGTYETSILPYDDCCTVFTPKHPKTKPQLHTVEQAEAACCNLGELEEQAIENVERVTIHPCS